MTKTPSLEELLSGAERSVAKRSRAASAKQSFSGVLRVQIDKIYVGKKDGLRALDFLRHAQAAEAG